MLLNTSNFIKRIEQVLADISAIEDFIIIYRRHLDIMKMIICINNSRLNVMFNFTLLNWIP